MWLGRGQVLGFLGSCLVACFLGGCGFKSAGSSPGGSGGVAGMNVGAGGQAGSKGTGGHGTGGTVVVGTGGETSSGDVGIGVDAATPNCGQNSVSVMPLPPDILIVQDRSLSMTDDSNDQPCAGGTAAGDGMCGAASKWSQTIAAVNQVVGQTQSKVNWGLIFLGDETAQCGAATAPVVDITPGASAQLIQTALNGVQFTGAPGTPTTAVMNNAVKYMQGLTDPNPKYLLLATDGEPNCAPGSTGNIGASDATGAENAVAAANTAGFPTFVVGIATTSDSAATNALNTMAVNGGEPQVGAATQYYAVTDTAGLETVLAQIIGKAVSCTIPLTGVSGNLDKVAVSAKDASGNTIEIMQDATNGWSYTDATKTAIILNGDACNNLKSVTYTGFQFIYTCATGIIVIG
jgi:hypothetical protein